jgi:hypothetical protein
MSEKGLTMTKKDELAKAAQMVKEAEQADIQACGQEIDAILKKHGCALAPQVTITGSDVSYRVIIMKAKDRQSSNGNPMM